jgi:hypothetical protein
MSTQVTVEFQGRQVTGQRVDFDIDKENWNSYTLEDGTKVRMRSVVAQIVRLDGEYTKEGDPVYLVNSTNVVTTDVPDHLKKKIPGTTGGKVN